MNWVKGFAVVTCLATPLSVITAVTASADPGVTSTSATTKSVTKVAELTDAEKKAKAADCSKQADTKKLHGEARRKFRAECKKG